MAVAVRVLQNEGLAKKSLIVDCDLHQGNGTAKIFQRNKDVFTFSIHQENIYPLKEKSDLDIGLGDFTEDEEYLSLLKRHLPKVVQEFKPDFIMFLAGADPFKGDKLGTLQITKEGLLKRDEFVINLAKKNDIPVGVVLAGGYAEDINDIVDIHYNTAKTLKKLFIS